MYSKLVGVFAFGVVAVGVVTTANGQQSSPAATSVDVGKYEYDGHCAICHGLSGTAQEEGAYSSLLSKTIPNLTTLSKNNGGVFPFAPVYQTIDGREQGSGVRWLSPPFERARKRAGTILLGRVTRGSSGESIGPSFMFSTEHRRGAADITDVSPVGCDS